MNNDPEIIDRWHKIVLCDYICGDLQCLLKMKENKAGPLLNSIFVGIHTLGGMMLGFDSSTEDRYRAVITKYFDLTENFAKVFHDHMWMGVAYTGTPIACGIRFFYESTNVSQDTFLIVQRDSLFINVRKMGEDFVDIIKNKVERDDLKYHPENPCAEGVEPEIQTVIDEVKSGKYKHLKLLKAIDKLPPIEPFLEIVAEKKKKEARDKGEPEPIFERDKDGNLNANDVLDNLQTLDEVRSQIREHNRGGGSVDPVGENKKVWEEDKRCPICDDDGSCSCHNSPPCSYCTQEGCTHSDEDKFGYIETDEEINKRLTGGDDYKEVDACTSCGKPFKGDSDKYFTTKKEGVFHKGCAMEIHDE